MTKQLEALIAEMKAAAEKCTSMKADVDENMAYANFIAIIEPSTILALIAALEHNKELQVKLDATEAVTLALRDDTRGAHQRIAALEATLELEREKSRRVMSRNHQLDASPLAVKLPAPNFKKLAEEIVDNLVDCGGSDDSDIRQYLEWTERTCRAAFGQVEGE